MHKRQFASRRACDCSHHVNCHAVLVRLGGHLHGPAIDARHIVIIADLEVRVIRLWRTWRSRREERLAAIRAQQLARPREHLPIGVVLGLRHVAAARDHNPLEELRRVLLRAVAELRVLLERALSHAPGRAMPLPKLGLGTTFWSWISVLRTMSSSSSAW